MGELRASLAESEPRARRAAIDALDADVEAESDEIHEFISTALGDEDFGVRWSTVTWIRRAVRWRAVVVDALTEALQDDRSPQRRAAATEALGQIGAGAVAAVSPLLQDPSTRVRRLAVDVLGLTHAASAVPHLGRSISDDDPSVRAAAIEALAGIATDAAFGFIKQVIRRADEAGSVHLSALLAFETSERALEPDQLTPHIDHPATAAVTLRLLGRAGVLPPLLENLQSGRRSRRHAALDGIYLALENHAALRARFAVAAPVEALIELTGVPEVRTVAKAAVVLARCADARGLIALAAHPKASREIARAHVAGQILRAQGVDDAKLRSARSALTHDDARHFFDEATELGREERVGLFDMSQEVFETLRTRFRETTGLLFEQHAKERLASRLRPVARGLGLQSWRALVESLDDGVVMRAAVERVTIHETYFFREERQLTALATVLVPAMRGAIQHKSIKPSRRGTYRVWSAGCASGEEAWTLAMLLAEQTDEFTVVGTDIAPGVVDEARRAVYGRRSFRGYMPPALKAKYLEKTEDQRSRIADALRPRARFEVDNLIDPNRMIGRFDAILCRNVLIYLSPEARAAVIDRFYDALYEGGVLFLGHSESLLHTDNPFEIVMLDKELAYMRPPGGRAR